MPIVYSFRKKRQAVPSVGVALAPYCTVARAGACALLPLAEVLGPSPPPPADDDPFFAGLFSWCRRSESNRHGIAPASSPACLAGRNELDGAGGEI